MGELKVGDKVFRTHNRYGYTNGYTTAEVVRVTKTQAVLDNENRLRRVSERGYYSDDKEYYREVERRGENYEILTPEKELEIQAYYERRKKVNWFNSQKFTDEDKVKIHNLLNP